MKTPQKSTLIENETNTPDRNRTLFFLISLLADDYFFTVFSQSINFIY